MKKLFVILLAAAMLCALLSACDGETFPLPDAQSGADSKAERKILLGHLTGYCAFANGDKMQAHKEKYTAIRRERRIAEQEAAVLEAMTEEADGNE